MKQLEEIKSLREKTDDELEDELAGARIDLFKFRTDLAMRSLANVKSIRATRKRVAKILTLVRERELAAREVEK
jgi:large subunit ribosomal protein L29